MKRIKINLKICFEYFIFTFSALEEHHVSVTTYMKGRLSQHNGAALMKPWRLWSPKPPAERSGSSRRTAVGCRRSGSVRFGRGSAPSRCTERYLHLLLHKQHHTSGYRESASLNLTFDRLSFYTTPKKPRIAGFKRN